MRKFSTERGNAKRGFDKASYRGQLWNVVSEKADDSKHLYYGIRKPYTSSRAMYVRGDLLERIN